MLTVQIGRLQLQLCCNQNWGDVLYGLDHDWRIVIELDGWVWCDDDHVFGKSIFVGFSVKLLIFLRFCGMSFMMRDMY